MEWPWSLDLPLVLMRGDPPTPTNGAVSICILEGVANNNKWPSFYFLVVSVLTV